MSVSCGCSSNAIVFNLNLKDKPDSDRLTLRSSTSWR